MVVSFSRPFKVGRGRKGLDLVEIGFEFTEREIELKTKILHLRDKVISHSDENEMVYKTSSLKLREDHEVRMPMETFYEVLHFNEVEYKEIEKLLIRLLHAIATYKFDFVQSNPVGFRVFKEATSDNLSKKDLENGTT